MGQRSFIIKVIIGSILIGIAVAANYCQLCPNHVACRPKPGFGVRCGNRRAIVPLNASHRKQILQIHDGLRSLVASGLVSGVNGAYPPAKRMGHMQWDAELAKIASYNAKTCYVHKDRCIKTVKFPWAGQNVGVDREVGHYPATNQSLYHITLKWFRQFELADATVINSYRPVKNPKKRYVNFATMVHDRQTSVGCAAVRFRYKQYYYLYLVCNYSMRPYSKRKVYEPGTPYSGCVAGRSKDYPSLCAKNEPIKAVQYPITAVQSQLAPYVDPLSYFGIHSPANSLQSPSNNLQPPSNNWQALLNGLQPPSNNFQVASNGLQPSLNSLQPLSNAYGVNNLRRGPSAQGRRGSRSKSRGRKKNSRSKNQKKTRSKNIRTRRNNQKSKRNRTTSRRRKTNRRNQTEIQSRPNVMFPNPFSFLFG